MSENRTVSIPVKITDENVLDIAETAGYGITYWATEFEGNKKAYPKGVCFFHDNDHTGLDYALTANQIRDAFVEIAAGKHVADWIRQYALNAISNGNLDSGIECGDVDSDLADAIVQVAAFGELVYG